MMMTIDDGGVSRKGKPVMMVADDADGDDDDIDD